MLQLTKHGLVVSAPPEEFTRLRETFDHDHCIRLRALIEPSLLARIQAGVREAAFVERVHANTGITPAPVDHKMTDNATSGLLHFLCNDAAFLRVVRDVTGCAGISSFQGFVYRIAPALGHFDVWHDDMSANRLLAMSVNLSPETYEGGRLQIRDRASGTVLHEVANTGIGDAIIFRISPRLQHRVSRVEGTRARTAYAGWFYPASEGHVLPTAGAH